MMHRTAAAALEKRFRLLSGCISSRADVSRAKILVAVDAVLDQYLSWRDYATEWDADQWGFGAEAWMPEEREILRRRCGASQRYPTEVI